MSDIKFSCSECGQHILCNVEWVGQQINCPTCQRLITIGVPPSAKPAAVPANEFNGKFTLPVTAPQAEGARGSEKLHIVMPAGLRPHMESGMIHNKDIRGGLGAV